MCIRDRSGSPRSAGCPRGRAPSPARRPRSGFGAWLPHRQVQREATPLADAALHADPPAMGLDDMLHQGQPDAAAPPSLRLTPSDAVELLEDSLGLGGWDPEALVRDLDQHLAPRVASGDAKAPALTRVLDGIVHQ